MRPVLGSPAAARLMRSSASRAEGTSTVPPSSEQPVVHARLLELLHDGGGILRRDAREQGLEIGLALVMDQGVEPAASRRERRQRW